MPGLVAASKPPGGLTGVRQELKYQLETPAGTAALEAMARRISPKIVDGSDSSFRVSIYLDTPDHALARRGLTHGSQSTKLRVKEYYQPGSGAAHDGGRCWLEVKARAGVMVEKSRFPVDRKIVREFIGAGRAPRAAAEHRQAFEAFEAVRADRPLEPLFVAHYKRWTFQDREASLRITFDRNVTFHLPPRDILDPAFGICTRDRLPPPLRVEDGWIVEVKSVGLTPTWIEEELGGSPPVEYSKFVTGVEALEAMDAITRA